MRLKFNIRPQFKILGVVAVVFGLIAFTERVKDEVVVRDILIQITNSEQNYFVEQDDILKLMETDAQNLIGVALSSVNMKTLEERIKKDPFIQDADLYGDLKGNITVKVELRRPVARIMRPDGPDGYIAQDGTIMPVSDRFTSRVTLITGECASRLLRVRHVNDDEIGTRLKVLIDWIRKDPFWNAQIAELNVDKKGRVTMLPQVGDEIIEFGYAENIDEKFKKLMIFYKEILPRVGWNKYDRVSLQYDGQIVAE